MKPVEDLVTSPYLQLELRSCLCDRYCSYEERNDDYGMNPIDDLYLQLFGKSISE